MGITLDLYFKGVSAAEPSASLAGFFMLRSADSPRTIPATGPWRPRGVAAIALLALASAAGAQPAADEAARLHAIAGVDRGEAEPIRCGDLVIWNSGGAVHAVRLADGRPPWRDSPSAADSAVFPRGAAAARLPSGHAKGEPSLRPCCRGNRVVAVLDGLSAGDDATDSAALACLDMSAAAEGRLAWLAPPPTVVADAGDTAQTQFDGPPTADAEHVYCVVRTRQPADWLHLAAYDLRDGRLLWTRPLGSAIAADGLDHAPRGRTVMLRHGRLEVDTAVGASHLFDPDGSPEGPRP